MTSSAVDPPTLHFRGGPASLESYAPIASDEIRSRPRLSVDTLERTRGPLAAIALEAGSRITRLHTSIARSTPPGTYRGSTELGGKRYPIELHVDPVAHLSLSPRQLLLSASAGERVEVDLTLANSGNVACVIGKTLAFGLYDVQGAERAIGAVFRQNGNTKENRADRLLEHFAEGHGGLARVEVASGGGSIAPGDVKPLRLKLHLPAKLAAGHTYSGILPLENLRYYIKVTVAAG